VRRSSKSAGHVADFCPKKRALSSIKNQILAGFGDRRRGALALQVPYFFPIFPLMTDQRGQSTTIPDFRSEEIQLPAVVERNEKRVRLSFWKKLRKVGARIPFAEEAASAYFCAIDRKTPMRVRATLLAALAYFVIPADVVPDFLAVIGFTDDATVLLTALGIVQAHIKPRHCQQARKALDLPEPEPADD
jgi:uncharacterized membrane protein YkvA (DUF1232 family)